MSRHTQEVNAKTMARHERTVEDIPAPQGIVAQRIFEMLARVVAPEHLSLGGGTVLAARWGHRKSLDVDLFCQPDVYAELGPKSRAEIEALIKQIPGCEQEATWCEDIATYAEIDGIEATVLPRPAAMGSKRATMLRGTKLRLQSSEEILYRKIVGRMYEAGEITVRDTYDVACALREDPGALQAAVGHIDEEILEDVIITIENLPNGWSGDDPKPLIDAKYKWTEDELSSETRRALATGQCHPNRRGRGEERR